MNLEIIQVNQIENILIDVTEEILDVSVNDFVLTSLVNSGIHITQESKIFYTFLHKSKHYQISVFNSSLKNSIPVFEMISIFHMDSKKMGFELFICKNFFVIYFQQKVYYYKEIDNNTPILNLKDFLENKFKIKIDRVQNISENDILKLKKIYINRGLKSKIPLLGRSNNYIQVFKYALYAVMLTGLISYLAIENNPINMDKKSELSSLESKYKILLSKSNHKKNLSSGLINILNDIKEHKLLLKSISYENNKYSIVIKSKSKRKLYEFIAKYKGGVINNLWENGTYYEMDANFYI